MTDTKIGQSGRFIGLANFVSLARDTVFWLSVFDPTLYTVVASAAKFVLGLYLALLLNNRLPFKEILRAIVLLPFVVPTVLSAIAFWWIYNSQFSIISWVLIKAGLLDHYIDFLGQPWNARWSVIVANIWRESHSSPLRCSRGSRPYLHRFTRLRCALVIAGDDKDAKARVTHLLDQFGFDTVDAGPLREGWRIQRDTPGYGPRRTAEELRRDLAAAKRYAHQ